MLKFRGLLGILMSVCFALMGSNLYGHNNLSNILNQDTILTQKQISDTILPFSLNTLEGEVFTDASLKGKVVILDFWATWCAPCKKLTKELNELVKKYHGNKDFQMLGVNYREYNLKLASEYWKESNYKFPMTSDGDKLGKAIKAGNPTLMVIDKDGAIKGRWDAYNASVSAQVLTLIEQLLIK